MHTSASVDIEDLPLGWNNVSADLVAQDVGQTSHNGCELFRDEVTFFVGSREDAAEPGALGEEVLKLLPPAQPIIIGRFSASFA